MMRIIVIVGATCWLIAIAASQEQGAGQRKMSVEEQRIVDALGKVDALYKARRYSEALSGLEQALALPEMKSFPAWRANTFFGIGCMHALLGHNPEAILALKQAITAGAKSYGQYVEEPDLASLRGTPEFAALLRGLRETSGIVPLVWDRGERVSAFTLMFEPAQAEQLVQMRAEFGIDKAIYTSNPATFYATPNVKR